MKNCYLFPVVLFVLGSGCLCSPVLLADSGTAIYSGGPIITMDDAHPDVEAVAVRDGRILAVGSARDVAAQAGAEVSNIDLAGKTLLPGFVDSHGHAYIIGLQATSANLLPPPDGEGRDIAELQRILRRYARDNAELVVRRGWIIGFGYDDSQLAQGRHPTRQELDAVAADTPVLIIHQSGHLGVANSKALELAGVTAQTPDPAGGRFRREAGSQQPSGVAEEYAFYALLIPLLANFSEAMHDDMVVAGAQLLASYGYTTGQEGGATSVALAAMQRVAASGRLPIDLVAYAVITQVAEIVPAMAYSGGFRVGGAKLTIDGSPQGKTAWLTQPYWVPPEGGDAEYAGYPAISEAVTFAAVERAFANGWQLLVHANGDAAIDRMIEAVRRARQRHPAVDNRPVLIHGQTLRLDQVASLKELGIFPSLFPMHTFYWGDWHRDSVLGPQRAENISPTAWVTDAGMMFGSHHDAPVAMPDAMRVLSATVTRRTRSGDILGPLQRVPVATALKAMTLWPAWQHFEEHSKGSLTPGKVADMVILAENPLTVDPARLADIRVLETIKSGRRVYRREAAVLPR